MDLTTLTHLATTGGEQSLDLLNDAITIAQNTVESWNELWSVTFLATENTFWDALVELGKVLAGFSILYLTFTEGKEILEKTSWSRLVTILIWPMIIMFFLGNHGNLLAQTVLLVRNIGHAQVQNVLEFEVAGIVFEDAIVDITIANVAREQIEALYNECKGLSDDAFPSCWEEKQESLESIIESAEEKSGGWIESLRKLGETVGNVVAVARGDFSKVGETFRSIHIPIIRFILKSVQWAFVNILEAALLLTATFAPIAMGLSLLPLQGRPIFTWLIGMIYLFGAQLGYNIIVGLTAVVIMKSNAELASDISFLFFISIFAPALAVLISSGGGIALYNGMSSRIQQLANILSNAIATVATGIK